MPRRSVLQAQQSNHFVYLSAIAQGQRQGEPFTAATIIDPRNDEVDNYRPQSHVGGPATARVLLARSDNGAAVSRRSRRRTGLSSRTHSQSHRRHIPKSLTGMLAIGGSAGAEVEHAGYNRGYSLFASNGDEGMVHATERRLS